MDYHDMFKTAVRDMQECGYIRNLDEIEPGVWQANETLGWGTVARELAATMPGTFRPTLTGGVTWQMKRTVGTLVSPKHVQKVKECRAIVQTIGANPEGKPLWSVGACARALLDFAAESQAYDESCEEIMTDHPYGYHDCKPGRYTSPVDGWVSPPLRDLLDEPLPERNPEYIYPVTLYDVEAYYYHLMCRLPSLRVDVLPGGEIDFLPMSANDSARWRDVLTIVQDHKLLRNSIAGCAAGSARKAKAERAKLYAYSGARPSKKDHPELWAAWKPGTVRRFPCPPMPGPFRAAGLLVVATGAELCYMESEFTDSVYSTADSVTCRGKISPGVWKKYGFNVRPQHQGDADIRHRGSWHIGPHPTTPYKQGDTEEIPVERKPVPPTYYPQWL